MHIRRRTQNADVSRPMVKCKCVGSHLAINAIPDRSSIIKIIANKIWFTLILLLLAGKERVNCSEVPKNDIFPQLKFEVHPLQCYYCRLLTLWACCYSKHTFPSGGQAMQMHISSQNVFSRKILCILKTITVITFRYFHWFADIEKIFLVARWSPANGWIATQLGLFGHYRKS